jgi:S1-C subfamily serine protease
MVLRKLEADRTCKHSTIGLRLKTELSRDGLIATRVVGCKSDCSEGLLRVGDLILRVDGRPSSGAEELETRIFMAEPGKELPMEVLRGDRRLMVSVPLKELVQADFARRTSHGTEE